MLDRIEAASIHELERALDSLFENATRAPVRSNPTMFFGRDSITGHLFVTDTSFPAQRLMVCRALVAKAKYCMDFPEWPDLPLRREAIAAMLDGECIRCNVVGMFGSSLWSENWSLEHPGFRTFVGGLLADRRTPIEIRRDPALLEEFTPCKLAGICGGQLTWRSAETLATERMLNRLNKAYDARVAAGLAVGP